MIIFEPNSNRKLLVTELKSLTTKLRTQVHLLSKTRSKLAGVAKNNMKSIKNNRHPKILKLNLIKKASRVNCRRMVSTVENLQSGKKVWYIDLLQILGYTLHVKSSFRCFSGFSVFQGTLSFFE